MIIQHYKRTEIGSLIAFMAGSIRHLWLFHTALTGILGLPGLTVGRIDNSPGRVGTDLALAFVCSGCLVRQHVN
jgi:hypothetical protein